MIKRPLKLLPVWVTISSVIIIAGIVLLCLMGFNTSPERKNRYSIEVRYDVSVEIDEEKIAELEKACSDVFAECGVTVETRQDGDDLTSDMTVITYIITEGTEAKSIALAESKLNAAFAAKYPDARVYADLHASENVENIYSESIWRGAVGIAVAAVVGLIYLGIRFGVGNAVTGLVLCVHDAAFTIALTALVRIPTYTFAPLLFAAIAAACSVIFWLIHCAQLRDAKKDATLRNLTSAESVEYAWENSWKKILIIAAAGIAAFLIAGGVAVAGVRLALMPAAIGVAAAAYSSLLLGPALHVHVKGAFDKFSAKHKPRYIGKKKAEKSAASEPTEN